MSQNTRERVMTDFRSGAVRVLMATNVAARGLDIESVEKVINYELADSPELFTHRAGRTGRMGRAGEAVTFLTPEDAPKWREIERALGRRLPALRWTENHYPPTAPSREPQPRQRQFRPAPASGAYSQRRPQFRQPSNVRRVSLPEHQTRSEPIMPRYAAPPRPQFSGTPAPARGPRDRWRR